ncbi:unnamed protein product [Paramecium primaurelia]|uniref:Uncharacterized protein n=1 Tax=Paramecium primaurelia TaxID=5886 RepID=A0A8S1NZ42_PARPR|nr:unnamed protein product [Paramecium primaurelia]
MSQINDSLIEAPLKSLLEDILFYLEGYLEGQNDLKIIENQLKDYDTLPGLVQIIGTVFKTLMRKVEKKMSFLKFNLNDNSFNQNYHAGEEYDKLEQIIQKYEAEIRGHISIEQQLKLFNDSLLQEIEDLDKSHKETIEQLNKKIDALKKDLGKSTESYRQLIKEKEQLRESVDYQHILHTDSELCYSDHRFKRVDYSSEYPASIANLHLQNSIRQSPPLKSQSQHQKCGKFNNQIQRRSSIQEQDLYAKYNQKLKQHSQSITQRSQIIQASQSLIKGGIANNSQNIKKNTINAIFDICYAQKQKSSQRNKSQGNNSKQGGSNSQNPINSNHKTGPHKMITDTSKTNEAIQRLLKLK